MERNIKRKSLRLKGFDYSSNGIYFVTICCHDMNALFGKIVDGEMIPNIAGKLISRWWQKLPNKFTSMQIGEFVVMPNHFHGLIEIQNKDIPLPQIISWFKRMTTNEYIRLVKSEALPPFKKRIWQRSFHDHIVRNEKSLLTIREYIENNPLKWELDCYYKA